MLVSLVSPCTLPQKAIMLLVFSAIFAVPLHKEDTNKSMMYPPQYGTKDHSGHCSNGEFIYIYDP